VSRPKTVFVLTFDKDRPGLLERAVSGSLPGPLISGTLGLPFGDGVRAGSIVLTLGVSAAGAGGIPRGAELVLAARLLSPLLLVHHD
jgi:hypothetical protein